MNTVPKISIVVPIYKAEKYLDRCLNSIINQTISDWECVLVDDGSPDESGKMCDAYVKQDKRFNVIHQENQGVSVARQRGLEVSKGDYIIHVDPDDWIEGNYLELLYQSIRSENADMAICDFDMIYSHGVVNCCQKPTSLNACDIIEDILEDKIHGSLCNKLVKRECFEKYDIKFPPNMSLWEDIFVVCSLLIEGLKVVYIPQTLYHYDLAINSNSIVKCINRKHIDSAIVCVEGLIPKLKESKYEKGLYMRKSNIKEMAFFLHDSEYDISNMYSEINTRYIKEHGICNIRQHPTGYVIALHMKGLVFVDLIYFFIRRIKKKLFK